MLSPSISQGMVINCVLLTNQFSHYFCDKIEKLKSNITLEPSQSATYMERSFTGSTITAFKAISREVVIGNYDSLFVRTVAFSVQVAYWIKEVIAPCGTIVSHVNLD